MSIGGILLRLLVLVFIVTILLSFWVTAKLTKSAAEAAAFMQHDVQMATPIPKARHRNTRSKDILVSATSRSTPPPLTASSSTVPVELPNKADTILPVDLHQDTTAPASHVIEGNDNRDNVQIPTTENISLSPMNASSVIPGVTWDDSQNCFHWDGLRDDVPKDRVVANGLIVTILLGPQELACQTLPNQLYYFAYPQGLDYLLLIDEPFSTESIVSCLNLQLVNNSKHVWYNDDDTNFTTYDYLHRDSIKVILGQSHLMATKGDPNFDKTTLPMGCRYDLSYIQGTRWYSNELLHLAILKEYDYFVKLDTDMFFLKPWNHFSLLADMQLKNAVYGHAGHYVNTGTSCTNGILATTQHYETTENISYCSENVRRNADFYYTNFMIGQVKFWSSPKVRHFGRYLSTRGGFLTQRWTDQVFWHNAMGLFVGPDFSNAVADYTDLRCFPDPTCWMSQLKYVMSFLSKEYPPKCPNGYFVHTKHIKYQFEHEGPPVELAKPTLESYRSNYIYNASDLKCRA